MSDTMTIPGMLSAALARLAPAPVELVGRSPVAIRLRALIGRAAALNGPVLLVGEQGADLEGVARDLHARRSPDAPLVSVNCAATSAELERLLFGEPPDAAPSDLEHVSADSLLASARGGALLLQEVTELPSALQGRLARVLRDGEMFVDGPPVPNEFHVIATAVTTIDADLQERRFRADLYRRLSGVRIDLPPLRQRAEDVPAMVRQLLDEVCAAQGTAPRTFTQAALALFGAVAWPGNLVELREVVERTALASADDPLQIEHVLPAMQLDRPRAVFVPTGNLRDARLRFERDYIAAVLQHHGWRMSDAALALGIQRPNLYRKARQLGIPLVKITE